MNRLLAVVAVLAVNVSSAIAQLTAPNPLNIMIESLIYSRDIDKDLGLDDDLARNLWLLRDEYKASVEKAYQDAGLNPRDFPTKMTPAEQNIYVRIKPRLINDYRLKAAALLSPEQTKRVGEIAFQLRLHDFGIRAFLEPAVASELQLTINQRVDLESLNQELQKAGPAAKLRAEYLDKATNLLTDEQRGILNELKGREFKSRFLAAPAGPGNRN